MKRFLLPLAAALAVVIAANAADTVTTNYVVTITKQVTVTNVVNVTNEVLILPKEKDMSTNAPLLSGPLVGLWDFLTASSNLIVIPFGTIQTDGKAFGGGLAALYKINDYALTGVRLDYWGGDLWMPSLDIQLQAPVKIAGKITVIPFVLSAVATPISHSGENGGNIVGIFGAGLALHLKSWQNGNSMYAVGDLEKWTSFDKQQIRVGLAFQF